MVWATNCRFDGYYSIDLETDDFQRNCAHLCSSNPKCALYTHVYENSGRYCKMKFGNFSIHSVKPHARWAEQGRCGIKLGKIYRFAKFCL